MPKVALTQKVVDGLAFDGKKTIAWDAATPGFGVFVGSRGKSFVVQRRIAGKESRVVLGDASAYKLAWARAKAAEIIAQGKQGVDTLAKPAGATMTFKAACEEWIAIGGRGGRARADRTLADYRDRCSRLVYPTIGDKALKAISRADVNALLTGLGDQHRNRSYVLTIVKAVFNFAVGARYLTKADENPAVGISAAQPKKDDKPVLTADEIAAFGAALAAMAGENKVSPWLAGLLRVSLLAGLRPGEVQSLKWSNVDLSKRVVTVVGKTGERKVQLSDAAIVALEAVPRIEGVEWVFAGRVHGQHLVGVQKQLARICTRAGIKPFNPYMLRHTAATMALVGGADVRAVQALLGHGDLKTTAGYLHSTAKRQRAAADAVASFAKGV
jgi:integrase